MIFVLLYLILISILAFLVESKRIPHSFSNNPIVYALSFSVLMTGWSYYGNVEKAAIFDFSFMASQVGITLSATLWWVILKRIIRLKEKYKINSLSDFLSLRYGKSQIVGVVVSLICCIAIVPYIALQWNALFSSLKIFSDIKIGSEIITVILTAIFVSFLGIRRLDPTEHHRGIVFVIAIEGVLKLLALIVLSTFILFKLNKGPIEFFSKASSFFPSFFPSDQYFYSYWTTFVILTASAAIFLPRQFHIAVVENQKEEHIKTAMWLFPLYTFLFVISAIPIAWQGVIERLPILEAKDFSLLLPLKKGFYSIALFVFLGGLSACFGMVILSTITVTTMINNHIIFPLISSIHRFVKFTPYLLYIRWVTATFILFISYLFYKFYAHSHMLMTTGLLAFTLIFQFIPAIIGGLFWKKGNKYGAIFGIIVGFIIWIFAILMPYMVKYGELGKEYQYLAFGKFLSIDSLSQGTILSFFINSIVYILVSYLTNQNPEELRLSNEFTNLNFRYELKPFDKEITVKLEDKIPLLLKGLRKIFPLEEAKSIINDIFDKMVNDRKVVTLFEFQNMINALEKKIAGIVGSAMAHKLIVNTRLYTDEERQILSKLYFKILADLNLPLGELRRKVDYFQERERILEKHAEELNKLVKAISTEKKKLSSIIEVIGDSVLLCDRKGRIVLANEKAKSLFGVEEKKIKEGEVHIYHLVNFFKEKQKFLTLYYSKKSWVSFETKLKENGKDFDVEVVIASVLDEAKMLTGKVIIIRDITFKKMAEKEMVRAEKMSSLAIIAGGIAHDFNNLLTAVSGNLELILYSEDIKKIKETIKKSLDVISKAKGLTRQLITFSKGGAPVKEMISLKDLIVEIVSFTLSGSNINFKFNIDENLCLILADKDQIVQVIQNITLNAKEVMPKGGEFIVEAKNVVIENHPHLDPGLYVKISFKDSGPGISKKILSRIFDPYFTTKKSGTGLGLSICYSIVKQHGGIIDVKSEEGKGATFFVYLPAVIESEKEGFKEEKKDFILEKEKGRKRILILEDEKEIREVLVEFLRMFEFDVDVVERGEDVISLYKKAIDEGKPYHIVLMDLTISYGMGGEECIKHLLKIDKNVKAIVMSGYSEDAVMSNYLSYGFKGRLKKPFSLSKLKEEIDKLL